MRKPRLLDLFCGAGGASVGYARAGFEVVGVDIAPQPHYPFEFHQADALTFSLDGFDVIHASPPCQDYARSRYITHPSGRHGGNVYPRFIAPMRQRFSELGVPWIIENVEDASEEMPDGVRLCGTSFGLRVWRHRLFISNMMLMAAGPCHHRVGDVSVRKQHCEYIGISSGISYVDGKGYTRKRPKNATKDVCAAAMGIDWMTMRELGEAIPPAYTEWLGRQLMQIVRQAA